VKLSIFKEIVEGNVIGGGGEVDRLHRLRKKMFWTKNSTNGSGNPKQLNQNSLVQQQQQNCTNNEPNESSSDNKSNKNLNFNTTNTNNNRFDLKKTLKTFENLNLINHQQIPKIRSNSLHYATKSNEINKHAKGDAEPLTNVNSHYYSNSNLKPFYSKLKKTHLFGVKLEKLCGPYSATNNKLPHQIMVKNKKI